MVSLFYSSAGFQISVNERKLEFGKAFRLNKTTMTITAEEFRDDFRLLISKSSAMETILRGLDPRNSPILNKEAVITYEKSGKLRITRNFPEDKFHTKNQLPFFSLPI